MASIKNPGSFYYKDRGRGSGQLLTSLKFFNQSLANYPNDPRIVTPPWQISNALMAKQGGLSWTF